MYLDVAGLDGNIIEKLNNQTQVKSPIFEEVKISLKPKNKTSKSKTLRSDNIRK